MRNIVLRLSYDGSAYHGWQEQAGEATVQKTLETAIERIVKHPVHVTGCGRTDAGVHALNYCANFRTDGTIPTERVPIAVTSRLPDDIVVRDAVEAPDAFNAIGCCFQKEYVYQIYNSRLRDPFLRRHVCFWPAPLDETVMDQAAAAFVGTHDFAAVRSVGTETRSTVRTIHWCRVERNGALITVTICANGFLYNMVRAIVGTLVYASEGKLRPADIPALLAARDRRLTGPTMPPQGLYMHRVWYSGAVQDMMSRDETPLRLF